jgi:type I restriction enzyme S subunit
MAMSNWREGSLADEVTALEAGVSVNSEDRPHGVGEAGVLKTSAIGGGIFNPNDNKAIWPTDRARARVSPDADSILVSRMNTPALVGESAYVVAAWPELFLPDRIWQLRMHDRQRCCVRWLGHLLQSQQSKAYISLSATGTSGSMKNLPKSRLLALPVAWPPRQEQDRVAEILDTVDEAIRKTEESIAKLKQVKQGLLHDLLTRGIDDNGELRDPARYPEQFKDSVLGQIPAAWNLISLGEVVPRAVYGISVSLDGGDGIPVLRMNNLRDGEADLSELKYSASEEAQNLLLRPGDVLFNRTNSIDHVGRTGIWRGQLESASFASYLVRLEADPARLTGEFLSRWLNWEATQIKIRKYATPGVHQVNINPTNLRRTALAIPASLHEQEGVVAILTALDRRLKAEKLERESLLYLKVGLTDDLLTGRVRVSHSLDEAAA